MQVKDEVLHKLRIVPDDQLKQIEGAYVFDVAPQASYCDRVVYMPHAGENFGNVGFLKLKILCQRNGIHLTTFGHLNQFTEMAILGDSVIAQPGDNLLDRLYCDPVSGCRVDQSIMRKVTFSRYIHGHEMSGMSHNYLLSREIATLASVLR